MRSRLYRALLGCLLYITTCTRLDIAYVVTQLSRFLENPGLQHWGCRSRSVIPEATRDHGTIYEGGNGDIVIQAYTDADWGRNIDDRRSVSGVMVMMGNAPIVFKSNYQRTELGRSRVHGVEFVHSRGTLDAIAVVRSRPDASGSYADMARIKERSR
ncbi:hypothetical protein PC110_g8825 [Phytophthora cactorum]|uniref:Uncharacterized protein n=1 Tax=Phytophthora cactorum TaxID=29920 RepID=A0A329SDW7_9STRA|nr:hypothetical protein PC110_g8825 [Phytophthora cactorum]